MSAVLELYLKARSGAGGRGCLSFASSKRKSRGGPDGGDGGRGGLVGFKADTKLKDLSHLSSKKMYQAGDGENGGSRKKRGKKGRDLWIKIPPQTWIQFDNKKILIKEDESYTLAYGGLGGRGNTFFKTSVNQAPRKTGAGKKGQSLKVHLQVKSSKTLFSKRIGIFGGSFDPPHKGHIQAVLSAVQELNLDLVYVIPSFKTPGEKTHHRPPKDRFQMTKDSFLSIPKTIVSDIELKQKKTSYTVETLRLLKKEKKLPPSPAQVFLILGDDHLPKLHEWEGFEDIIQKANIAVCLRSGLIPSKKSAPPNLALWVEKFRTKKWLLKNKNAFYFIKMQSFKQTSSSLIREKIKKGAPFKKEIPKRTESKVKKFYQKQILLSKEDIKKDVLYFLESKGALKPKLFQFKGALYDYIAAASGLNTRHVRSLFFSLQEHLQKKYNIKPLRTEGEKTFYWAALDYSHLIVHIFYEETRKQYDLEEFWQGRSAPAKAPRTFDV